MDNITTPQAVTHLASKLKEHPDYRETWKANIAMCFYDEFNKTITADLTSAEVSNNLVFMTRKELIEKANTAADNFLNLLCLQQ